MSWRGSVLIGLVACGRLEFQPRSDSRGDGAPFDMPTDVAPFTTRHWVNRTAAQPGALLAPRLVFDGGRRELLLYGGDMSAMTSAAMWKLTSAGWVSVCNPCAPGERFNMALAYDRLRDRVVLFGGQDGSSGVHNDTWEWDGTVWTQRTPTTPPSPHDAVAGVAAFGETLMIGGVVGTTPVNDVFAYDGSGYTSLALATPPNHVAGYGMFATFDSVANRVIVLGDDGDPTGVMVRDDAWSFDQTAWTQICSACTGMARNSASIVFDPDLNITWMVGGFDGSELAGSYQLHNGAFVQVDSLPPARDSVGLAYDPDRHVIVMYGGNGSSCAGNCAETWELVPN